jgi:hypothetical protein
MPGARQGAEVGVGLLDGFGVRLGLLVPGQRPTERDSIGRATLATVRATKLEV